jgi:ElaB/YqjD/DUF883 family membrane-anchored ribosome-binding protein
MATIPGKMKDDEIENKSTSMGLGKEAKPAGADASSNISKMDSRRVGEGWSSQIQEGANELASRSQEVAGKVSDHAQEVAHHVSDHAQEIASNVTEKARAFASDFAGRAQGAASQAAKKTTKAIKDYPMQSLLVGFGIGCLVGFLIPRR